MRVLFLFIGLVSFSVSAQDGNYQMGARNASLGSTGLTTSDHWSLFYNIAGLAQLESNAAFASYRNRYNLAELQTISAGYVHKVNEFGVGIGVFRFGGDLFSEQKVSVAIGHKLDRISLGVGLDYIQYDISSVGTKSVMIFQFGGIAQITDELSFGAHIFNLNQAELVSEGNEKVPTVMRAGLSFQPNDDLILALETEKDLGFEEVIKVGVEYRVIQNVFVRTGLKTEPFSGVGGFGFEFKNCQIDYAFANDNQLGSIHEVSFSCLIGTP